MLSVADRQCLALSEAAPLAELSSRAMARPSETRHDPILLLGDGGRYVRHLTIRALLAAATAEEPGAGAASHRDAAPAG